MLTKLNTLESIFLICIITVTRTILSFPQNIIENQKSASILNLIFISIIAFFTVHLICKLFKKFPGLDIIDISEIVGGKIFKNIIGTIFVGYFIITSSILLRNFCETLKIVYYPMTNIVFILILFLLAISFVNKLSISTILKTNSIIVPLALLSIIFLFFANTKNFMLNKIFPILGNGFANTFILGISNLSAFGGISFIYFLPPLLEKPENLKKISIISICIITLCLILSISTLLFMFSFFETNNKISPLYNTARYIEFGKFFQRLESIFLFIWIILFACYLSITSYFSISILKKILHLESQIPLSNIVALLMFSIATIPKNYAISSNFENTYYPLLVLTIVFLLGIGILILGNMKRKKEINHE